MQKILLLLFLLLPFTARAQFFDFGFGDDDFFSRPRREQVVAPSYKGGAESLEKYLESNYKNPKKNDRTLSGVIVVVCIVNEKGRVKETHVMRGLREEFDAEAVRVCRKMKFIPAHQGKKKVKGRFDVTFPIRNSRLSFSTLETIDV